MTNKEAINILKYDRDYLYTNNRGNDKPCYNEEAYKLAIKALEERPKGKWITHSDYPDRLICSNCNHKYDVWFIDNGTNFCPNCGANMIKEGNNENVNGK